MSSSSLAITGNAFGGAGLNRTTADWLIWENDPNIDWMGDAWILRARAWDLFRNDPVMAALHTSKLVGTHGSKGLAHRSLYSADGSDETTPAESDLRRKIDNVIKRYNRGFQVDAGGQLSRVAFEKALDSLATVAGEGFAIRAWIPGRPRSEFATCWKIIRPERVCNPPGMQDNTRLFQGIALDVNGAPEGLWVAPPRRLGQTINPKDWVLVPWHGPDGTPNVIHRTGLRVPGMYRAVTMYAPNMLLAKQIKGCIDAYVVAKRIQACYPIFITCRDPVGAAEADQNGVVYGPNTAIEPGKVYYLAEGLSVNIPSWTFNGADMRQYIDTLYRNQFASWGLPIDVVLAQLGETNMAASRSAWQQYYRQCEIWQDEHIEQVSSIIDECAKREAVARGELPADVLTPDGLACRYVRPPRSMPDPLKEAQAVALWTTLKRDRTGLWAESGVDFDESIMQRAEDDKFMKAQGVDEAPAATDPATGKPIQDPKGAPDDKNEDKPTEDDPKEDDAAQPE
jgi:capsid protein